MNLRLARLYEGPVAPPLTNNPAKPAPLWLDTSGNTPVLKTHNANSTAWVAVDSNATALAKLTALDAAATALAALGTDLDETVAKADIDDAGTIDGTEIAAMLSTINTRVNAIATEVNAIVTALKAVG